VPVSALRLAGTAHGGAQCGMPRRVGNFSLVMPEWQVPAKGRAGKMHVHALRDAASSAARRKRGDKMRVTREPALDATERRYFSCKLAR